MINKHQRKRQFIAWLLQHYRHANPTVNYLLEFLMVQPDYIQHVEFSDQVEYASHGVYISYVEQTAVPFRYYKEGKSYSSCEQAFHDLRLNTQGVQPVTFYIELNIPDYVATLYRYDLFTQPDYLPEDSAFLDQLEMGLTQVTRQVRRKQLKEQVDLALDQGAFDIVNQLLNQLEELEGHDQDY